MAVKLMFGGAVSIVAFAACAADDGVVETGDADAYIGSTTVIPSDGECTRIVVTRLSDFHVSEYRGFLSGASFKVSSGESHVAATAYPQPCSSEPAAAPWIADEQIVTFQPGANTLALAFHANTSVTVDPTFDDDNTRIAVRPGSAVRTGRNGEGASSPNYALDGWEVKVVTLPPPGGGGSSETLLFSFEGKGPPYTPRDITGTFDGRFVAQVSETFQPLWVVDGAGNPNDVWPVIYPPGTVRWDNTDGLEAIDTTHYVRTGFLNTPINCDASGDNCLQSGLDLLEVQVQGDGSRAAVVTRQIFLPELPGAPLNTEYPVGVAPIGPNFVVTTLPAGGTRMVVLDASGALVGGPTMVAGDVEGLFQTFDGRIAAIDYTGNVSMYNPDTTPRAGETGILPNGIGLALPNQVAWNPNANQFFALSGADNHLYTAAQDFSSAAPFPLDLSGYALPVGLDVRADANQLLVADRLPPFNPATGARMPAVDFYDITTQALVSTVRLNGIANPLRTITIGYIGSRQQIVSHYRRPGGVADASLDAVVFTHNLDGTLAGSFDLRPLGFPKVSSVTYLPATDEILMSATDITGRVRLVVTSAGGQPRRSYRTDAIAGFTDIAPITSGAFGGDFGVITNQPSQYVRVSLQ